MISFVIALISMIREQREVESAERSTDDSAKWQQSSAPVAPREEEKPEARGIDVLASRIKELAAGEQEEQQKGETFNQLGPPERFPVSGTISVQDLAKKRGDQR